MKIGDCLNERRSVVKVGKDYENFLRATGIQEEKDTYAVLTEKYKKINCIKNSGKKKTGNRKYINIAKKIDMCITTWAYEWNEKKMSSIRSKDTEFMALNQLNEDPNYKGISRDIKARFDKYQFHFIKEDDTKEDIKENTTKEDNKGEYYFDDEGYLWKTTLFDMLGIKFCVKDKSTDNIETLSNICMFEDAEKDKNINKLFALICTKEDKQNSERQVQGFNANREKFYIARCELKIKKMESVELDKFRKKFPFAEIMEDAENNIINIPIFFDFAYYNNKNEKKLSEKKNLLKKNLYEEPEKVEISIDGEKKAARKKDIIDLGLEKYFKTKYILVTRFPKTNYSPVYFALFRSINNNIFFRAPSTKDSITAINLERFYKDYYGFLNEKIKDEESGKENYWLSEKLFGINFIKKLVEKMEEFRNFYTEREVLIFKKSRYQDKNTKNLTDLINAIIQIDEPELRILYLDIFVDVNVDLRKSTEYLNEIKENELVYWQSENDQNKKNDTIQENDTIQKKISTAKEGIDLKNDTTIKRIIEKIQEEPDLTFLANKKYKDHITFICKNTEWLSKFTYPKEEVKSYGYYIEE